MKDQLKILLDKVYELEGLLNLVICREDVPENLLRLIDRKGNEINNLKEQIFKTSDKEESNDRDLENDRDEGKEEDIISSGYYSLEEEKEEESPEEKKMIPQEEVVDILADKKNKAGGKLVFSVNDRIRFKKELFDNSDVDFNNTLALVASMDSYDEAEDYFVNDQGWKLTADIEKEFLQNLKRYFR